MTLNNLKSGMCVETAEGHLRLVLGNSLVSVDHGGIGFSNFDDDLLSCIKSETIVKVYDVPKNREGLRADLEFWYGEDKHILEHSELLWERSSTKEMTVAQVEKELGYSVKIIKG